MADKVPQTLANHARFDPAYHFFIVPVFVITWITTIVELVRHPGLWNAWMIVVATAAAVAVVKIRTYALKVQDRVIRLEERLRLAILSPQALGTKIPTLTESQLVGLRFASDGEVVELAERSLAQNLSRADIKKAVQHWRPDYWRV
jgi:hypothetical protein